MYAVFYYNYPAIIECMPFLLYLSLKIVSEYDQEIPQSQTADKPVAAWRRATQQ